VDMCRLYVMFKEWIWQMFGVM